MATSFRIEHDFKSIPLEKFVAYLNDPKLNEMLEDGLDFDERKLVSKKESPGEIEWRFKVKKTGDMPAAVKKFFKGDSFGWRETSRLVKSENCIYWEINPEADLLKFHGEGVWKLEKAGKGCKRIIEGKVSVDVPFVGKMIEGIIVNQLKKSYETEPSIQEEFYSSVS